MSKAVVFSTFPTVPGDLCSLVRLKGLIAGCVWLLGESDIPLRPLRSPASTSYAPGRISRSLSWGSWPCPLPTLSPYSLPISSYSLPFSLSLIYIFLSLLSPTCCSRDSEAAPGSVRVHVYECVMRAQKTVRRSHDARGHMEENSRIALDARWDSVAFEHGGIGYCTCFGARTAVIRGNKDKEETRQRLPSKALQT